MPCTRLIQGLRHLPSNSGTIDPGGPEVFAVVYKVIRFYWIIDICMNFNELIVRRK